MYPIMSKGKEEKSCPIKIRFSYSIETMQLPSSQTFLCHKANISSWLLIGFCVLLYI